VSGGRIRSSAHGIVRQQELAESIAIENASRLHRRGLEAGANRKRVRIERRIVRTVAAGPEPGATDFMRMGLAHNVGRDAKHLAGKDPGAAASAAKRLCCSEGIDVFSRANYTYGATQAVIADKYELRAHLSRKSPTSEIRPSY
jgi:hypothetical protein